MSRRRWVYTQGGEPLPEPVEVDFDWRNAERRAQTPTEELIYGKTQALDGTDLSTRRRHREYMEQRGLAMTSDFTNEWAKAGEERAKFLRGEDSKYNRDVRDDVARAWYKTFKY